tara:strand:+ start:104 stop:937 length:834 start_codon:yes stop_codon:yes gene_type:complete
MAKVGVLPTSKSKSLQESSGNRQIRYSGSPGREMHQIMNNLERYSDVISGVEGQDSTITLDQINNAPKKNMRQTLIAIGEQRILGRGEINIYHKEEEIKLEGKGEIKVPVWDQVVHPNNAYRRCFDFGSVLLVLYLMWKIPFDISFDWYRNSNWEGVFLGLIDCWFFCDILLNFRTGFLKNGTAVMQKKKIVHHYLAGWFIVDLLGTIPFELFVPSDGVNRKTLKLVKYFKIPKLLRVSRVLKYFRAQKAVFDLVKVFLIVVGEPASSERSEHNYFH